MLLDFEIAHVGRQCSVTGRTFAPGETYFSTLRLERGSPERSDFAAETWQGPPEGMLAWWKSKTPGVDAGKPKLAPHDVLLNLFSELSDRPDEHEFRYVLGLLLIRRKLLKLEETRRDDGVEVLVLDCPRRNQQFELPAPALDAEHINEIQKRLIDLLYGGA